MSMNVRFLADSGHWPVTASDPKRTFATYAAASANHVDVLRMKFCLAVFLALLVGGCSEEAKPCQVKPEGVFCPVFTRAASNLSQADKASLTGAGEWPRGTSISIEGRQFLEFGEPVRQFFQDCGITHPEMMWAPFNEGLAQHLRGGAVDMRLLCARYKALMIPPPPPQDPDERS
jgi:hypothetical protein